MISDHDREIIEKVNRGEITHRTAIAELDALVMTHDQLYEFMRENGCDFSFALKPFFHTTDDKYGEGWFQNQLKRGMKKNDLVDEKDQNLKKDQ